MPKGARDGHAPVATGARCHVPAAGGDATQRPVPAGCQQGTPGGPTANAEGCPRPAPRGGRRWAPQGMRPLQRAPGTVARPAPAPLPNPGAAETRRHQPAPAPGQLPPRPPSDLPRGPAPSLPPTRSPRSRYLRAGGPWGRSRPQEPGQPRIPARRASLGRHEPVVTRAGEEPPGAATASARSPGAGGRPRPPPLRGRPLRSHSPPPRTMPSSRSRSCAAGRPRPRRLPPPRALRGEADAGPRPRVVPSPAPGGSRPRCPRCPARRLPPPGPTATLGEGLVPRHGDPLPPSPAPGSRPPAPRPGRHRSTGLPRAQPRGLKAAEPPQDGDGRCLPAATDAKRPQTCAADSDAAHVQHCNPSLPARGRDHSPVGQRIRCL
ncbi:proline-rich protein 2-like [Neopelma chrysocephalum]|uniref:proline-rich protein 2-like n=1 Tax=Neopelma chrysocephalum TaxID=114329 RepID=UPI000FCCFF28|nr:proline-rich protein 2-like [Neopelma chrysocephalum]